MWRPDTEGGQEGRGEGGSLTVKQDKLPLVVARVSEHTPSHLAVITLIPSLPLPELMRDSHESCQGSLPSEPGFTHPPLPHSCATAGLQGSQYLAGSVTICLPRVRLLRGGAGVAREPERAKRSSCSPVLELGASILT